MLLAATCFLVFFLNQFCYFPGARSQSASVLSSLQELKDVRDELNNKESQLQDLEGQLAGLRATADKYVAVPSWGGGEGPGPDLLPLQVSAAEAAVRAEGGGGADPAGQAAAELLPSAAGGAGETARDHR